MSNTEKVVVGLLLVALVVTWILGVRYFNRLETYIQTHKNRGAEVVCEDATTGAERWTSRVHESSSVRLPDPACPDGFLIVRSKEPTND